VPGAASGAGEAGLRPGGGGEGREERSFEELQRELDEIVAKLERGDVAVDDAIELFRRGEELYETCVERLEAAELRIEELAPERRE
jgi:exodeoxyribonuclease VII small subunit